MKRNLKQLRRRLEGIASQPERRQTATRAEMWDEILRLMREMFVDQHGREPADDGEFDAFHEEYDRAHPVERADQEIAELEAELAARAARR